VSGRGAVEVAAVSQEMEQARLAFLALVAQATPGSLHQQSSGTRWTNRQLLFHMVFGYLVVRTLLPLVRGFGRLPPVCSRWFSAVLEALRLPYHVVNYAGSCLGGALLTPSRMAALLSRTIATLRRDLERETDASLALRMAFPVSWDPYFTDTMSVLDVYHFGTEHFAHHRQQLTLSGNPAAEV
jgi:hypothetical protein